jgi:hypothetical protein
MPSVPVPAGLSLGVAAYVTALRTCQPSFEHSNFDTLPFRALLLLPVQSVHALYPGLPAMPLQPPAGWPCLLGQLATCAPELRASPSLATLEATMPDRLKAAVAAAAGGEEALGQHDTWWRSADGSLAAHASAAGRPLAVYSVSAAGHLDVPPDHAVFDQSTAAPACVVEVPKPKYLWSDAELAAYSQARPQDRAGLRPTHHRIFFFFSRDGVTDLKTPRGGGQRQEPKHQEPSRPEPALKQAPRARRRQDRTGQDRTRPSAGGEQRGEQAGTHTRKHTSKRSGHRGLAKRRRGPQDTYKRLTEPTSNNLTKLQPVPRAS